MGNLETAF